MVLLSLINAVVPVGLVFIMMVVGSQLTPIDFRRALGLAPVIAAALVSQWLLLALITIALIFWLAPPPVVAGGLVLVAVSPVAPLSNFYVMLARGNLGLAVSLTAASSLLALASAPLSMALIFRLLPEHALGVEIPAGRVLMQSLLTLVLPLAVGMAIRARASEWVAKRSALFQRLSLTAVVAIVALILATQVVSMSVGTLSVLVALALLFTIVLAVAGILTAGLFGTGGTEVAVLLFSFPARNLGFATLLAVQVVGRAEFAVFAAAFFVVQLLVLVPLAIGFRRLAGVNWIGGRGTPS